MKLPFSDEVIASEMVGKPMSMVSNKDYSPIHEFLGSLTFLENGKTEEGYSWETEDGALRILDVTGACLYEFRGLESKNDCTYMVGSSLREEGKERKRVILHFKKCLSEVKFAVCISTHKKYREHSLPPLIKSIKKAGLQPERVFVSTGASDKEKSYEDDDGIRHREIKEDYWGFTALSVAAVEEEDAAYWLLLHDTCAVEPDFISRIESLDIGLNPDMILFREPGEHLEIGLYRSDFLATVVPELPSLGPSKALQGFLANSRMTLVLGYNMRDDGEKDVYGTGVRRNVLVLPSAGIRKFRAKAVDGGKA